ncbi:unnamed protein product [Adineta steineri]|uniref:Uncharacterized protein n=1 Tax=Adineta steineri TaxID=433720 RepID=A0A815V1I3_9BILA|nr:unnamed protein product [Adineta steineri]CAF1652149.1 unnamed protein product [Adineta steineri]
MGSCIRKTTGTTKQHPCGGNPCPRCGKCADWTYDGDLKGAMEHWMHGESDEITDQKRWHRHPNATCAYIAIRARRTDHVCQCG